MNILFTNYFGSGKGGGEMSMEVLAKELSKKHKVVVASSDQFPGLKNYLFEKRKGGFKKYNEYLKGFFYDIIKKEKIDIIHGNDRLTSVAAILAGKKAKIKTVVHFRDYWFACPRSTCLAPNYKEYGICDSKIILKNYPVHRWPIEFYKISYLKKIRPILKSADKKIAISNFVKNKLKLFGIDSIVIPNPVDIKSRKLKDKKFIITYVGDLTYTKGILPLYETMKDIAKGDIYFYVVGDGPLRKHIKQTNNIKVFGKLPYEKVLNIYAHSSLAVVPSIWQEPFGRTAIEAMAFGLPVIASKVGGLKDIVKENKTGFLVHPLNLGLWKFKIELLIKDKKLRNNMSKEAKKEVKKYEVKKIAKLVENVYLSKV